MNLLRGTESRDLVDRIMQVMEASFDPTYGEAWNRRQVGDALIMPSTNAILVDQDGEILDPEDDEASGKETAGFVLSRHAADEEELLLIAVLPDLRGRGLGEQLIRHLFNDARSRQISQVFLEMRRGNPAIHLYERLGFQPIGERPNYYRLTNGERVDAITFGCNL